MCGTGRVGVCCGVFRCVQFWIGGLMEPGMVGLGALWEAGPVELSLGG